MIGARDHAVRTDAGRVRVLNEDAAVARAPLFAVVDGMGGHDAGDVASALVVEVLEALGIHGPHSEKGLQDALELANARIRREALRVGSERGMGATAVGVLLGHRSWAFNIGDSRLYRIRAAVIDQLSKDHSAVQELVDAGRIDRSEARCHPDRNVVTRAVGVDPFVHVDVWPLDAANGDRLVICSDGLSGELDDEEILSICITNGDGAACADGLLECALERGGHDNVTVIVVDVGEVDDEVDCSDDDTNPRRAIDGIIDAVPMGRGVAP